MSKWRASAAQSFRLQDGGRIDRERPISFSFDGRIFRGFAGDTLASGLLANGVRLLARSFKFHRPRGVMSAGTDEPNGLVCVGEGGQATPNQCATQIELYEGLAATSQNCWPSLRHDWLALIQGASRLLPAGFYYKTFMWPPGSWRGYENLIRRMAGMGRAPTAPDPDRYEKLHAHCDVMVVGAGPGGLAAALAAGETGARVILADEQSEFGGTLLGTHSTIDERPALDWVAACTSDLAHMPEVRLLNRSTVFGHYDHNYLAICQRVTDHLAPAHRPPDAVRQRLWKVRANQVVLTTGAHERPLLFADNDRPGIMLASAAQTYANRYAVRPGLRAVLFTNNDSAYECVLDLIAAGIQIVMVVDPRSRLTGSLPAAARDAGLTLVCGHTVTGTRGVQQLNAIEIAPIDALGNAVTARSQRIDCDLLCVSGGWSPAVHLFSQARGALRFDSEKFCFVPDTAQPVPALYSAGAVNGEFQLQTCLAQGLAAGLAAARAAGFTHGKVHRTPSSPGFEQQRSFNELAPPGPAARRRRCFVDFQNDVTVADIELSAREGYDSVEHLKRYTTAGMGTDQGKSSNVNALAVLARSTGSSIDALGTTTFRPPYTPVTVGTLAGMDSGEFLDPIRRTPMYLWHVGVGASMEIMGPWQRAVCYPQPGEDARTTVTRECLSVNRGVGLADLSSLGKIELCGADTVEFLNRIYTSDWRSLEVGRCRYGLMLNEAGGVLDDGIVARLGENHFLLSTSSGNELHVRSWLERWLQCEWVGLDVWVSDVTSQYAVAVIAGPLARGLLDEVCPNVDVGNADFPFMSVREGQVAGIPARIFRTGFIGELAYEINVAAGHGMRLWETLWSHGKKHGIGVYGTEAMQVMRTEMGYVLVGQETDASVTPDDLGMAWMIASSKNDFLGKRSLDRAYVRRTGRKQLVGLLTADPNNVLAEGAHIVSPLRESPPMTIEGHVTSSGYGSRVGRSIALALLQRGRSRHGEWVNVWTPDKLVQAKVTGTSFYDPQRTRIRG